jgi:SAM-dependent methyltransferase
MRGSESSIGFDSRREEKKEVKKLSELSVPRYRDVQAFHDRAHGYEMGGRGKMHREIATRTAEIALSVESHPRRVLDVGCGTGFLLRVLAGRLQHSEELIGIDAAAGMIDVANEHLSDSRLRFSVGVAETLPFPDAHFDLVVSTTSFDHWEDQLAGLVQCSRVLSPDGHLVLTDLFSLLLLPTLVAGHQDRARTRHRAGALLARARFNTVEWRRLYATIIATAVASKQL